MRTALLVLIVTFLAQACFGQHDSIVSKPAGFEGAHIAIASAFVLNSARLNIDFSLVRGSRSLFGLRGMLSADEITFSHSSPPRNYVYGAQAFLGIRASKTQFDLAFGPIYLMETRYHTRSGWTTYLAEIFVYHWSTST